MVKLVLLILTLGVVLIAGCASQDSVEVSGTTHQAVVQESLDADFDDSELDELEQMMREFDEQFADDWQTSDLS